MGLRMALAGNANNIVLATQNWIDMDGTIVGGAEYLPELPLSNIAQDRLSLVARTGGADALNPWILADIGQDINPVSLIAFPRHGLSDAATWRIRGMQAKFITTSIDQLVPTLGSMPINIVDPINVGADWFLFIRNNSAPDQFWMIGQITGNVSPQCIQFNCVTIGPGLGSPSGPWDVFILSPNDRSGCVKYDNTAVIGQVRSSSNIQVSTGSHQVTTSGNSFLFPGSPISVWQASDSSNWMVGHVDTYDWTTGILNFTATGSSGTAARFDDVIIERLDADRHVWPEVTALGQSFWGNDYGWGGRLLHGTNYSPPAIHYLPLESGCVVPFYARFWLIEMADPANSRGYLDFAKLILSPAFQPSVNISFNWKIEWVDPSLVNRTRGGQVFTDPRPSFRRLSMVFENQQTLEAFSHLYELDRMCGRSKPVLAIVMPTDTANLHRVTIYGSMPNLPALQNTYVDRYSKNVVIEEWI